MTKTENVALPPDMASPIRLQERQERQQAALEANMEMQKEKEIKDRQGLWMKRHQTPLRNLQAVLKTRKGASQHGEVDDDALFEDLLGEVKDPREYAGGAETSPKRGGQVAEEDEQSPAKSARTALSPAKSASPRLRKPLHHQVQIRQHHVVEVNKLNLPVNLWRE